MNTELIALIANLALALSFVVGLIFGIAQVKTTARDRRERLTLETLRNYQSPEFAELMIMINTHKFPSNNEGWKDLSTEDKVLFLQFAQQMETLGLLVAERFISIDLVDKTLGSFVTNSWEKFKTLVLDMRTKQSDPFLSEYFQWLAEELSQRMKLNPRKPFHERSK